jgi:hypothetical protein
MNIIDSQPTENKIENETCDEEENLENYKGIYFNDDKEEQYYEGGAHFKYTELCKRLENIILSLPPERRAKYVYNDSGNNSKSNTILKI